MSHEPYAELAAAYALGALDAEARVEFEAHRRTGCGDCETALREYAETVAALAAELPPVAPPPGVKARILQRIAAQAEPAREAPARRRRPFGPFVWGSALAAAAVLVLYLAATVDDLRRALTMRAHEVASLEAELSRLRGEVAHQRELLALLRAPDTRVVSLAGLPPSPSAQGRVWWQPDARLGFFVTAGLPPAPSGKTYQLWVISGGKPISAGVFEVDPSGSTAVPVGPIPQATTAEVFAVTLEPAGGLPAPSGQMYLAGKTS